jgi:uncharacterized protein YkwD
MSKINYDTLEREVFDLVNQVRSNPKSLIPYLTESIDYFKGDILCLPGKVPVTTLEGSNAFLEAINFLNKQKPVPKVARDNNLSHAAHDHVKDIGSKGLSSHEGSDGSSVTSRIERYCEWDTCVCENIEFGGSSAEEIVANWIVDDGVPKRGHRANLFLHNATHCGIALGSHTEFEHVSNIIFTGGVRRHGEPSRDLNNFIQDYLDKTHRQESGPKNAFQEEDWDAPDDTVSVSIQKSNKVVNGKSYKLTRKIYTLADGSQHMVEIEE